MSKLKAVILDIVGQLFNKTVSITRDAFVIADGITQEVDGVVTKVKTIYLTGTTGAGITTLVPHGVIDAAHILDVSVDLYNDSDVAWDVEEYKLTPTTSNGYAVLYNDTNIILANIGVSFRNQPYKAKVTYIVD